MPKSLIDLSLEFGVFLGLSRYFMPQPTKIFQTDLNKNEPIETNVKESEPIKVVNEPDTIKNLKEQREKK